MIYFFMGEGNHIPGNCFQKERDLSILSVDGQNFPLLPTCFAGKNSGGTKSSICCGGWNSLMLPLRIDKGENVQKETWVNKWTANDNQ